MSKMDALRAMREAKYAASQARGAKPGGTGAAAKKAAPVAPRSATPVAGSGPVASSETADSAAEALCGHRNMSGRTCTREQGHAAKSHRYS
jgi:hypothetical protein